MMQMNKILRLSVGAGLPRPIDINLRVGPEFGRLPTFAGGPAVYAHPAFLAFGGPPFGPDQWYPQHELRSVGKAAPRVEAAARLHTLQDRANHPLQISLAQSHHEPFSLPTHRLGG